ncbi:MAG: NADP-dependent oxidoreductase [Candidatus Baltobacteraceae bacterium]
MIATQNNSVRLAARPTGLPKKTDWRLETEAVRAPAQGEVLLEVLYLSLDPAMRGWMNEGKSYVPPVGIGEIMRSYGLGRVIESDADGFAPGDYVRGVTGAQEYATMKAGGLTKVDLSAAPLPTYLSALGITGLTAYFGLFDAGEMKSGETVVISAAAGAVGMIAGQVAKIKGCRAIGIAGGPVKCKYIVDELGFDAAIDYKNENVHQGLRKHCPDGLDIYFDNVGGEILEAALGNLRLHARIVICGAISQYNTTTRIQGPRNYMNLLVSRARMQGMLVMDYASEYGKATIEMARWMKEGKLKSREDVVEGGIEVFPDALLKLFNGENTGKLILKLARD